MIFFESQHFFNYFLLITKKITIVIITTSVDIDKMMTTASFDVLIESSISTAGAVVPVVIPTPTIFAEVVEPGAYVVGAFVVGTFVEGSLSSGTPTATVELGGFVFAIIVLGEPPAAGFFVVAVLEPSDVPRPPPIASSIIATPLEKASVKTIEDGKMTKDLALITSLENVEVLSSLDFIKAVRATLETM